MRYFYIDPFAALSFFLYRKYGEMRGELKARAEVGVGKILERKGDTRK